MLARSLLNQHGLADWRFKFDRANRRFGCCDFARRTISLSRSLTLLNDDKQVCDTLLHEIAHALTPGAGHGASWKSMCIRIGARPVRCYRDGEVVTARRAAAPLKIGCPTCNWWANAGED